MKQWLRNIIKKGKSPRVILNSFLWGICVALLPIVPLQTPLVFIIGPLLGLKISIVIAVLFLVNNPFTMVPIYFVDYQVGRVVAETLGLNLVKYNPSWAQKLSSFLGRYMDVQKYMGIELCMWYLLLGGIIIAGVVTALAYYPLKRVIYKL